MGKKNKINKRDKIGKMDKGEIIKKITQKKEFSKIPQGDIQRVLNKFYKKDLSGEEIVKSTRDSLRKIFSGFSGRKLMGWKEKSAEDILRKHLSTRERYDNYKEIYERILKGLPEEPNKKLSIIDLGAGVNGMSYNFFEKMGKEVDYRAVEAVGQFVEMTNQYFKREGLNGKAFHISIFDLEGVKKVIKNTRKPRVLFLFKVVDSIEKVERDYTKKLLDKIVPFVDRVIISFATESWVRRKKFHVQRKWLTDFIDQRWQFTDDFNIKGERYLVFEK